MRHYLILVLALALPMTAIGHGLSPPIKKARSADCESFVKLYANNQHPEFRQYKVTVYNQLKPKMVPAPFHAIPRVIKLAPYGKTSFNVAFRHTGETAYVCTESEPKTNGDGVAPIITRVCSKIELFTSTGRPDTEQCERLQSRRDKDE